MAGRLEETVAKIKKTIKKTASILFKKLLLIALPFILIIIMLGAAFDAIMDAFADTVANYSKNNPVQYNLEDNSIMITDEQIDNLIKQIEAMGTKMNDLHLSKDSIKKFYAAEVVTQEVNRGVQEEEGKYYGRVYVKRASKDNESTEEAQQMGYIPYDQYMERYNRNDKEISNCFTVNENGQIVLTKTRITTDNEGKETVELELQEIDYKNKITKYIMPFEFLVNLCVATQNPEFVSALADRVIQNTQIVIMVMQNEITTETEEAYKYKEATSVDTEGRVYDYDPQVTLSHTTDTGRRDPKRGNPQNTLPSENDPYKLEKTVKTKVVIYTPVIQPTSVKTWIMDQKITYNNNTTGPEVGEPYIEEIEDEKPVHSENGYRYLGENNDEYKTDKNTSETTLIKKYQSTIKYKVNRRKETTVTTTSNNYTEGVREDVTDSLDEFIELLKTPFTIPDSNVKEAPIYKLENGAEIFFNMLHKSERTQELEQLMRYVLYLCSGKNYGVTEFDFSIFEIDKFVSTRNIYNLSNYLRQFSHSGEAPKSPDGKYYLMYGDGVGWPTIGNADLQWKSHHSEFNRSGKVLKNGIETEVPNIEQYANSFMARGETAQYTNDEVNQMQIYIEVELVDEIGDSAQETTYNRVLSNTAGLSLSKQQLYALTSIVYNFGHIPERNGYTFKSVYEAGAALYEINSWQHNKFIWDNWWCYLGGGASGHIPSRDASFETYVKGIYDFSQSPAGTVFNRKYYIYYTQDQLNMFNYAPNKPIMPSNKEEIFTYEERVGGDILAAAEEVHKIMEDEKWTYSLGEDLYSYNIEKSLNNPNKVSCCATFVSCALYEAGYATEEEMNDFNYNSSHLLYDFMKKRGDCIEITSYSDLQAGDIVFMYGPSKSGIGHVQIYAGEGKWYNAGGTGSIRQSNPYSQGKSWPLSNFITAMRIN